MANGLLFVCARAPENGQADFRVNNSSLLTIMYLLGYTDRDIKDLLQRNAAAAAASTL